MLIDNKSLGKGLLFIIPKLLFESAVFKIRCFDGSSPQSSPDPRISCLPHVNQWNEAISGDLSVFARFLQHDTLLVASLGQMQNFMRPTWCLYYAVDLAWHLPWEITVTPPVARKAVVFSAGVQTKKQFPPAISNGSLWTWSKLEEKNAKLSDKTRREDSFQKLPTQVLFICSNETTKLVYCI